MADPAFVSSFFTTPEISESFELDGIVTIVDAKNALRRLPQEVDISTFERLIHDVNISTENKSKWDGDLQVINESLEQISVADTVIINKVLSSPKF
jgi:G3E family GTPase